VRQAVDEWRQTRAALDADARHALLGLARRTVEAVALSTDSPIPTPDLPGSLQRPGAAFVTLYVGDRLRGCIGAIEPRECSLAETIVMMARAAACEDPRFDPLHPDELPGLYIEISVLGPLVPVESADEIVVGRDGLVVEEGHRRGLLLPQVPAEWGWDRETFLAQTCAKAGLPPDAWRRGARVFRFEATVFGEPRPS
jgi:AmmeMemoRadiSam system protein A